MQVCKLALYGMPGAGKSTTSDIISKICKDNAIIFYNIRLADPIYECQNFIYKIAGRPLKNFYLQDGILLNFLGLHLRKINPNVLVDKFHEKLTSVLNQLEGREHKKVVILCDDMRYPDYKFLVGKGFKVVKIEASAELCMQRKRCRGDLSLGSYAHKTELGIDSIKPDYIITNDSTLDELYRRALNLLKELLRDFDR